MLKKIAAMILAVVMTTALFSGCGGGATSKVASKAAAQKTTINFWSMYNESEVQAVVIKDTVKRFMDDNPNITVNTTWVGRDIRNTIKISLEAGQKIDVIQYDPQYTTMNCQKYLLKLDTYIDKSYAITGNLTIRKRCMPVIMKWIKDASTDGGTYGIPSESTVVTFLYNKAQFVKAGITKTPETWEDFLGVCDKLKAAGITPFTMDDAYMDLLPGYYLARLKGQVWVKQLVTDKTGEMWKDPAVLEMAQAYDNMRTKGYFAKDIAGSKWPAGQQSVGLGQVAMYITGNWLPNEIKDLTGPNFEWGAFPFPSVPGGVDANTVSVIGAEGFEIAKTCKNPDAAFGLLTYFNSDKTEKDLVDKAIDVPVTPNVAWPEKLKDLKPIFNGMTNSYVWSCGLAENPNLLPIILSNFTKVLGGTLTPQDFVNTMVTAAKKG